MKQAILVFEVLSYRYSLGLDHGNCDSRVLSDHCLACEDKHLYASSDKKKTVGLHL